MCLAGLSYTTFRFTDLVITSSAVSFTLQNNGTVAGAEVAQLYLAYPEAAGEPPKVLRGFSKILLEAGASQVVRFVIEPTATVFNRKLEQSIDDLDAVNRAEGVAEHTLWRVGVGRWVGG